MDEDPQPPQARVGWRADMIGRMPVPAANAVLNILSEDGAGRAMKRCRARDDAARFRAPPTMQADTSLHPYPERAAFDAASPAGRRAMLATLDPPLKPPHWITEYALMLSKVCDDAGDGAAVRTAGARAFAAWVGGRYDTQAEPVQRALRIAVLYAMAVGGPPPDIELDVTGVAAEVAALATETYRSTADAAVAARSEALLRRAAQLYFCPPYEQDVGARVGEFVAMHDDGSLYARGAFLDRVAFVVRDLMRMCAVRAEIGGEARAAKLDAAPYVRSAATDRVLDQSVYKVRVLPLRFDLFAPPGSRAIFASGGGSNSKAQEMVAHAFPQVSHKLSVAELQRFPDMAAADVDYAHELREIAAVTIVLDLVHRVFGIATAGMAHFASPLDATVPRDARLVRMGCEWIVLRPPRAFKCAGAALLALLDDLGETTQGIRALGDALRAGRYRPAEELRARVVRDVGGIVPIDDTGRGTGAQSALLGLIQR